MNDQIILTLVSAFAGGFSSFLFVRLAEYLTSIYQRANRHLVSLRQVEQAAHMAFNDVYQNQCAIDGVVRCFTDMPPNEIRFLPIRPYVIEWDRSMMDGLGNADVINEVFGVGLDIASFNRDLSAALDRHDKFEAAFLAGNITPEQFLQTHGVCAKHLAELRKHTGRLMDSLKRVAVVVRIRAVRDRTFMHKAYGLFIKRKNETKFDAAVASGIKDFDKEAEAVKERSGATIARALADADQKPVPPHHKPPN